MRKSLVITKSSMLYTKRRRTVCACQRRMFLCGFTAIVFPTGFWWEHGNNANTNMYEKGIGA